VWSEGAALGGLICYSTEEISGGDKKDDKTISDTKTAGDASL
jgi:hypothetical protein